jgi:hypothetical protein
MKSYNFANHSGFKSYKNRGGRDGEQWEFEFDNKYGASVIKCDYSYGGREGLFELSVLYDNDLCYSTPITDDIIGYLTEDEVSDLLDRIEQLNG